MTISEIIAALALVVSVVRTLFDIVWQIYMERKHAKKACRLRLWAQRLMTAFPPQIQHIINWRKSQLVFRVLPPLMVTYLLALLFFFRDGVFATTGEFITALAALAIFPALAA